ncbi:hypothetical protein AB0C93_33590 [Streptomyces sp. NPDC048518]
MHALVVSAHPEFCGITDAAVHLVHDTLTEPTWQEWTRRYRPLPSQPQAK